MTRRSPVGGRCGYHPAVAAKEHPAWNPRISNRRAFHEYTITGKLECGIVLEGSEVKSLRQGKASLQEAFARIEKGKLILHQCHIDPYEKATMAWNHNPLRERVLLAHRREIRRLEQEIKVDQMTLIPLSIYFKDGRAKVELGLAKGKKKADKRESIKQRDWQRDKARLMRDKG